jgi:hypothetical protein
MADLQNDEAPAVPPTEAPQENASRLDSPAQTDAPQLDAGKAYATARAQAAMLGAGLYRLEGGAFLLTRWGLARELPDLGAVADLLRVMRGAGP